MQVIQTYVYKPHDPGYLRETEGARLPEGDIDGIRAVARWIHRRLDEGWSAPLITVDGLLLRYPPTPSADGIDSGHRHHEWIHAGDVLVWTGFAFECMGAYVLKDAGDE